MSKVNLIKTLLTSRLELFGVEILKNFVVEIRLSLMLPPNDHNVKPDI